eukprot:6205316-Pleurochrysis_carterae.AAC.4
MAVPTRGALRRPRPSHVAVLALAHATAVSAAAMTSQLPLKSPLQVSIFSMRPYLVPFVQRLQQDFPETKTFEVKLDQQTAKLAQGSDAVCAFVNDDLSAPTLEVLAEGGVRCVALRCAGYDRVDCDAATSLAMSILRVPGYSPYAIAEHAVCLMLSLNRQIVKATERVRYGNFALSGLVRRIRIISAATCNCAIDSKPHWFRACV